jgi:hypothetical protein
VGRTLNVLFTTKTSTVKGVICDATMNTLTIVTEANDTLSFGTANAEKNSNEKLINQIYNLTTNKKFGFGNLPHPYKRLSIPTNT